MKTFFARLLFRCACWLDPWVTKPITNPLHLEIHSLRVDRDRYKAAHDRVTNEYAHYLAVAYSGRN